MPEQRKLVSVLFADIVGSTPITLARDPEVVRAALRFTFDELRPILESHGGTVEKFIGDEVMAVFGVPVAHDDDADRAVRAAFAVQRRVLDLNQLPGAIELVLRIGINTGETVAGTGEGREFLVTGEPVIAAARLRGAADPGEIVVGVLTHRLTKEGVSFGGSRTFDAKGIGRLELWPALELRSDVPVAPRGVPGLRAPLIGRDHELRLLRETFERVAAERSPSLVTVFGAAGSGKSRLTSEFAASLPPGTVRFGRCLPYGDGITFYPLQQIIRADLGIEINTSGPEARATLRAAVASAVGADERESVAQWLEAVLALRDAGEALQGLAGRNLMDELRWSVRRYFERRALRPLILVFEDLHWAEPALIEAIEHLAEWTRAPILLLCSARPEFRDDHKSFGAHAANSVSITLSPLERDETERLVSELLRIENLPVALREDIISRAEGNPLYVEEFVRTLIETGRLTRDGERWIATGPVRAVGIPPSLQGLITARLDRVSPASRRLLQSASIVGRLFSMSALAAIAGEAPSAELILDAARRDLIVEVDERAPGEGRVHSFKHPLFRDVTYSTIPKTERIHMHANYASWLEATLGGRAEEVQEIVAYHTEQSYACAAELGDLRANALGERALDLLIVVADRARRRGDAHAAHGLYVRASAVAEATRAPLAKRVHTLGNALIAGGEIGEPSRTERGRKLDDLLVLARELPPSELLLRLLNGAAVRAFERRDIEATQRLTVELAEAARAIGDADLLAHWLGECAERADWWGDRDAEERFLLEAVDAGRRATSAFGRVMPLVRLAGRTLLEGDYARASEYEREIDAIDFSQSPFARATYLRSQGRRAYLRGDFEKAIDSATQAISAYRELGAPKWLLVVTMWFLGDALLADGRDDRRARDVLEEGSALAEALEMHGQIHELHARVAIACLRLADVEAARTHVAAAKREILADDPGADAITATAEAWLALADGDVSRAHGVLTEAAARIARTADAFVIAQLQIAIGEVHLAAGHPADARESLARARDFFRGPVPRGWQDYIDRRLARAAAPTA
jgi:class 3 adenylate cyclase